MIRTCDEQGIIVYYKCDTLVYRRGIGMKGREENPVLVNDADAVPACLPCACVCVCVICCSSYCQTDLLIRGRWKGWVKAFEWHLSNNFVCYQFYIYWHYEAHKITISFWWLFSMALPVWFWLGIGIFCIPALRKWTTPSQFSFMSSSCFPSVFTELAGHEARWRVVMAPLVSQCQRPLSSLGVYNV